MRGRCDPNEFPAGPLHPVGTVAGVSWTCPECHRTFGRTRQGHECAPAMSLDEYFATGPERERPIWEAVAAHLDTLGPVVVEPVSVGILVKRSRTFLELRPKVRWEALSFSLDRELHDPRIARKMRTPRWTYHVVNVSEAAEIDDQVREWLTESYLSCPE